MLRFKFNYVLLSCLMLCGGMSHGEEVLHIYSHRHYKTDEKVNALFTEQTGIQIKVVQAEADQLIARLRTEGAASPADVLITVDAGRMQRAAAEGLLQPVVTDFLKNHSPEAMRDAEGKWWPFTLRARGIVVAKDRVKVGEISTYQDLAKPEWRGRVLSRSSTSSYNQALLAYMIATHGEEKASEWAKAIVENFARPPQGGDRDQIKAVAAGLADACLTNSYYLGLLLNSPDPAERKAAESVRMIFPNQGAGGTHCNVSAAGITAHSQRVPQATRYLEFLLSEQVQRLYATETSEHPVMMNLDYSPILQSWGKIEMDMVGFPQLGKHMEAASRLFDQAGWK